jgi:hypothetical protein
MRSSINSTLRLISIFIFLAVLSFVSVKAQIDERGDKQQPRTTTRVKVRIETKIKVVKVPEVKYQKISGIAITTVQPNAGIVLESANPKSKYKQVKNTNSDGILNLENVPAGKYVLTVSLKGFVTEESEIEVKPAQLVTVPVNLAQITHDVSIKTNVLNGELRYAPIQKIAGNASRNVGGYCMIPIKNGSATITRMQEGDYNLEIHPDDVEYQTVSKEVEVSEAALAKTVNAAQRNEIFIESKRTVSTEDFIANWKADEWKLPANWKIENKRMKVESTEAALPQVALLQNERFNHYKDFELKTNIRSLDNKSVGFVLRAKDDKNYYLIQITGSAANEPYFLTGYIVKNGKIAETLVPANIKAYAQSIGNQKYFNLTISAKGNIFKVTLEDIETGRSFVIGIIEDQNNTFPIGANGIGTKDASRFEVNQFYIIYK